MVKLDYSGAPGKGSVRSIDTRRSSCWLFGSLFSLACCKRFATCVHVPMCNCSAIHFKVTAVSTRSRRAMRTFLASPLGRRANSAPVQPSLSSSSFRMRRAFCPVVSIHHMVDRAGIFNAQRAGHDQTLPNSRTCVNTPD